MVGRIIVLIAIIGLISLVSIIHGHVYANLIIGKNEINNNQIQPFSPIAILINNQSTNKELMSELKSQIQHSDPFKVQMTLIQMTLIQMTLIQMTLIQMTLIQMT